MISETILYTRELEDGTTLHLQCTVYYKRKKNVSSS